MPEAFDPYYDWLGISPDEQPPDHYRLLGVKRYEANAAAISNAADQRVRHLRSVQTGKRMAESQKLLGEVSAASTCLLMAERKLAYDQQLRQKEAVAKPLPKPMLVAQPLPAPLPLRPNESGRNLPVAKALDAASSPGSPVILPQPLPTVLPASDGNGVGFTPPPFLAINPSASSITSRKPGTSKPGVNKVLLLVGAVAFMLLIMVGAGGAILVYSLMAQPDIAVVLPVEQPQPPAPPPTETLPPDAGHHPPSPVTSKASPPPSAVTSTAPKTNPGPNPHPSKIGTTPTNTDTAPPLDLNVEVGPAVDLLALPRTIVDGSVSVEGSKLKTGGVGGDKVEFAFVPPPQYLIDSAITREKGNEVFALQILVEGRPCAVLIDAFAELGSLSGLERIQGQRISSPAATANIRGKQLENGKLARLRCLVVRNHVVVELDGKILVNWVGNPNDLSRDSILAIPNPMHVGIFTWDSSYVVDHMRLYPVTKHNLDSGNAVVSRIPAANPSSSGPPSTSPPTSSFLMPGNLLVRAAKPVDLLTEVPVTAQGGEFTRAGNSITTKDNNLCKIEFGYEPPPEYYVDAFVTRLSGKNCLSLNLLVEGRPCSLSIDAFDGSRSGLEMLDGQRLDAQPSAATNSLLPIGQTIKVQAVVIKNRVLLFVRGRPVLDWNGDPARLQPVKDFTFGSGKTLGLTSLVSSFSIPRLHVWPITGATQMPTAGPPSVGPPSTVSPATGPPPPVATVTTARMGNLDLQLGPPLQMFRDGRLRPRRGGLSWGASSMNTTESGQCIMEFEHEVAGDYILLGQVTRKAGSDMVAFDIVAGGRTCTVVIDGFPQDGGGPLTGLETIDGKRLNNSANLTAVKGQQLELNKPAAVKIAVIKDRIIAEVNGRTLVDWRGESSRLSTFDRLGTGKTLSVSSLNTSYEVRDLVLYPITGSSVGGSVATGSATPDSGNTGVFSSRPKQKVPDDAAQEKSKQRMKEALGDSIAKAVKPEDKLKLAKQFVDVAAAGEDVSTQYVLMQAARKMSVGAHEFDYALSLVDHLARDYEIDPFLLKLQTLQEAVALPSLTSGLYERLATLAETLTTDAEESERTDILEPASKVAFDAINKTKNVVQKKSIKTLRDRIVAEKQQWDLAQAAIADLQTSPDDADKNLLVGRFYATLREDWSKALPHLVKGSDQGWSAAAKAELAAQDAEAKLAAAESWFGLIAAAPTADKLPLQTHSVELLEAAMPQLSGLSKVKAEKRIGDLKTALAAAEKADPDKVSPRSKKGKAAAFQPGLIARTFRGQPFNRPTHVLGIVKSSDDYRDVIRTVIEPQIGSYGPDYLQMVAIGYVVLDQDEAVKFDLTNCICMLNNVKVADPQGSGASNFELKLKKGRHAIMLYRSDPNQGSPTFQITTAESRKNPLQFSLQDLQIEAAKPITYNGRTSLGQVLYGLPGP